MSPAEPYLNYPVWNSEEEDARMDVLRHMNTLADDCMGMAMFIANVMDKNTEDWRVEDLEKLEKFHHELTSLQTFLKTLDL